MAALGFDTLPIPSYDRALHALRSYLDCWRGIDAVSVGMHRQGYDLQLTQYDERGWRATFYLTGMEHSFTSDAASAWEPTSWRAVQVDAAQALNRRLLHRVAEQGPGDLGLPHQHVRAVAKLSSTFHELLSGCPGLLRAAAHFGREHCATIEMGANAIGQVFMASGAPIRAAGEGTREKLVLPERPGAWRAHRYGMVPAIVKEKSAFFAAEPARQATVKVDHAITVEFDGVFRGEHLQAARTRQLRFHSHPPRALNEG
jgi:hypothetical protein